MNVNIIKKKEKNLIKLDSGSLLVIVLVAKIEESYEHPTKIHFFDSYPC